MAWTTPRTWVVGELVSAAIMNAHVRDNLNFLYGSGRWQLDFVTGTGAATAATTEATAGTIITGTSLAYDTSPKFIEFFAPTQYVAPEATITYVLYRGATVACSGFGLNHNLAGAQTEQKPIKLEYRDGAPSSGSYAYSVRAWVNTGTATVSGGAGGGGGALAPVFLRVSNCP